MKKIVKIANGAGKEGIIMDINTLISVKREFNGTWCYDSIYSIVHWTYIPYIRSGNTCIEKNCQKVPTILADIRYLKILEQTIAKINHAVLKQTAIFFGIPMSLAIIHSIFGMRVSYMVMELLGTEYMVQSIIMTGVFIHFDIWRVILL